MNLKPLAAALLVLAAAAHAAPSDPSAALNRTFTEYSGSGAIGNNNLNDDTHFFWMYESSGNHMGQAVDSWFLAWDPLHSREARGTVTFTSGSILFVHDDKAELIATAGFGKAGVTYDYSRNLVGLEAGDKSHTSFSGATLTLKWNASTPGDHIRVMTAVPEASTYAMLVAGLFAIGIALRRRTRHND